MRSEFPKRVKLDAWTRSGGACERCHQKIITTPEYHHHVPAAIGGSNDIGNCEVLCVRCHRVETSNVTVPEVAKSARVFEKRIGLRKSGRGFRKSPPGYDAFNRRMRDE